MTVYAIRGTNLITFDSATPGTVASTVAITGLTGSAYGMAFRPATSELYVLDSTSRLYRLNITTGAATQVGSGTFPTLISNGYFGVSFNPVADRLRAVSSNEENFRFDPDTAAQIVDTTLNPVGSVVAAAYTNPVAGATATTLYGIDSASNNLVVINPPNSGTVSPVGALGVTLSSQYAALTIDPRTGIAYAVLDVSGPKLYTINLASGAATLIAPFAAGASIENLAVAPVGNFQFAATTATVNENSVLSVIINRSGDSSAAATVQVTANSGTATPGVDYYDFTQTVSFAIGETSQTIYFRPFYDFATESAETAQLSLSNPTGGAGVVGGSQTVTINDVARSVSSATWFNPSLIKIPAVGSSGIASPYPSGIDVSGFLSLPISKVRVSLFGVNHTFPADIDMVLVAPDGRSTLLMSDAGGGSGISNVNLNFDDAAATSLPNGAITSGTYKPTDLGTLADTFPAPGPSAPFGSTLANLTGNGPNGQWRLFVVDDLAGDSGQITSGWSLTLDTPPATFAAAPVSVTENAGNAVVTITRSGNVNGNASVDYTTANGSANSGSDYTATSGTLQFANGETSKTISIPILNDAFDEATESFNFTLSNPKSEVTQAVVAPPATFPITITDDDALPVLSIANVAVTEGNSGTTDAVFTVTLAAPSQNTVTVDYSAPLDAGNDYLPTSGTLSFAPGVLTRTFTVRVVGDTIVESDENFTVTLSAPVNATLPIGTATLTILNDDVAVSIAGFTPASGSAGASIVISGTNFLNASQVLVGGVAATFTVDSATQITAIAPPGATTGAIRVVTPAGSADSATAFGFVPVVSGFSPVSGRVATSSVPATMITVNGNHFTNATQVLVGTQGATFTVDSDTQLRFNIPATATTGKIVVVTPAGTGQSALDLVIDAPFTPLISNFSPSSGAAPTTGAGATPGTPIVINGSNFGGATQVLVGGVAATFTVDSATQISTSVPSGAAVGNGNIQITTPAGTTSSASVFVVAGITRVTPTTVTTGRVLTIDGVGLGGVTRVLFDRTPALFEALSPTRILARVPDNARTNQIRVVLGTASVLSRDIIKVLPRIVSIAPNSAGANDNIIITGNALNGVRSIKFGTVTARFSTLALSNFDRLRVTVPLGAFSSRITITTAAGSVQSGLFRVLPRITRLTPLRGAPGTRITISGSGFASGPGLAGATQVLLNNRVVAFTVANNNTITATVPANATSGLITVRTIGGSARSTQSFTVIAPPDAPKDAPLSSVRLSSGSASSSASEMVLNFTGALNPSEATQTENFTLEIDGAAVELESAAYRNGEIVLGAPESALRAGQTVIVRWNLHDARGALVQGATRLQVR